MEHLNWYIVDELPAPRQGMGISPQGPELSLQEHRITNSLLNFGVDKRMAVASAMTANQQPSTHRPPSFRSDHCLQQEFLEYFGNRFP